MHVKKNVLYKNPFAESISLFSFGCVKENKGFLCTKLKFNMINGWVFEKFLKD